MSFRSPEKLSLEAVHVVTHHAQLCMLPPHTHTVCTAGKAAWPVKSKVAVLLSAVVRQQGAAAYAQLMPQLLGNVDGNVLQVRTSRVLQVWTYPPPPPRTYRSY